jgi:chromosome segregation ATPase
LQSVLRKAFTGVRDAIDVQRQQQGTLVNALAETEKRLQALEDRERSIGSQVSQMESQVVELQATTSRVPEQIEALTTMSEAVRSNLATKLSVEDFHAVQQVMTEIGGGLDIVKGQISDVSQRTESITHYVSSGESLVQHKYHVQQLVQEELLRCTDTDVLKMPSASLIRLRKLEGSIHLLSSTTNRLDDVLRVLGQKQDAVVVDVRCAMETAEGATKVSREARYICRRGGLLLGLLLY